MTWEQVLALMSGIAVLATAVAALLVQVNLLRRDLNGRMTELLSHAVGAAHREGELAGRDYVRRQWVKAGLESSPPPLDEAEQDAVE